MRQREAEFESWLRNRPPPPPPLWREPSRAVVGLAAAAAAIACFLPFAIGSVPDYGGPRTETWSGFDGAGDGAILLALALLAAVAALHRVVADSPTRVARLAPLIIGTLAVFTALNGMRQANAAVEAWRRSSGDGGLGPGALIALVASMVLLAGGAWLSFTRRRRAIDPSDQWRVSWRQVVEVTAGLIGALAGFVVTLALVSSRLNAMLAPLMLMASLVGATAGFWLAARLALAVAGRLRGS